MGTSSPSQLPDNVDMKPSFRKLSNDAAQRKYRRRSPVGGSGSSSSSGSPSHDHGHSPIFQKAESRNMYDDRHRRKEHGRDTERDSSRYRGGKDNDYFRHKDNKSYGSSHDYRRHNDDHNKKYKHADEDDRSYHRSAPRSVRESRGGMRSDHAKHESDHDKYRERGRFLDKYTQESPDDAGYTSRDKDRETTGLERDRYRERGRDGKRDHRRNSGDYKNNPPSSYENSKGHARELSSTRASGLHHSKEAYGTCKKEPDEWKEEKRKSEDRERDSYKERRNREVEEHLQGNDKSFAKSRERDVKSEPHDKSIHVNENLDSSGKKIKLFHAEMTTPWAEDADEKPVSSSKAVQDGSSKVTAGSLHSSASGTDTAHDLNAAKVAAMKAAELVNRNLVGGGFLTTDQKKKLLWGNKKNASTEESGNRWDTTLFPDRERQEKFNKLMGVKGDLNPEHKPNEMDPDNRLQAEKQNQLQMDLEKQYTAGLRRRDGRTVGLGL
ncbi:uncharacterized protein [Aristolochia californica]|uniref:uncharacterized protein isoform X2 n=1 Tax=Aristolochia californica TaxID=171875 RepID=UPI0035DED145